MVETLTTNEVTSILLAIGLLLFSTTLGGIFENTIYQKILKEEASFAGVRRIKAVIEAK